MKSASGLAAAAALALVAGAAPAEGPATPAPPAARSWNQEGGNAARTSSVQVEPLVADPVEEWAVPLKGDLLAGPVHWEGTLFVLVGTMRTARLLAVSAADGRTVAVREGVRMEGERAFLASWNGSVFLTDARRTLALHPRAGSFQSGWVANEGSLCAPAVRDGVLHLAGRDRFISLALDTGKVLGNVPHGIPGPGPMCLLLHGESLVAVSHGPREGYMGEFLALSRAGVSKGGFLGQAQFQQPASLDFVALDPWLTVLEGEGGGEALFVSSPCGFRGEKGPVSSLVLPFPSLAKEGAVLGPIARPSIPWKGHLIGFDEHAELLSVDHRGRYTTVVTETALPKGAWFARASAAGPVAYFGNWALDLRTRRVLWALPALKPATALQPSGNGRLVVVDREGRLLGLVGKGESGAGASAGLPPAAGSGPAAGAGTAAAAPTTPPTGADGLILLDGREVPGTVAWEGGTLLLAGEDGAPRGFPPEEVAIASREGKVLHLGSHGAVLDAWRRPLRERLAAVLLRESGFLGGAGRVAAARRLVEEARRWTGTGAAADAAERALSGKAESKGAVKAVQEAEGRIAAARAEARRGFEEGSAWCAARGLAAASSILLSDASDAIPGSPYPEDRLDGLVPPEFPWKGKPGERELWRRWAPILAEADAAFVGPDHPALRGTLRPPWDRETIHLRTPEILLSSRVTDPDLVGPLFVRAARTLAALEGLLGRDNVIPVRDHHDLLDVRLHRSRKEYLDENLVGAFPMPWSAGVYSPAAGGSRFHLPDAGDADALGRGLAQVLSHELVHHFLDRRWRGKGRGAASADLKGHWCVEGIARFVEDQMDTPLRTVVRLDDPRAPCVDASARAAEARKGFLPSRLVRMSDRDFGRLGSDPKVEVRLKNTVGGVALGPRSLFYENAGALAFFLVHRRGPEGRAAFLRYLADHYSGRDAGDGARALGFDGPEALDAAFAEFLRGQ